MTALLSTKICIFLTFYKLLVNAKANIEIGDNNGETALYYTADADTRTAIDLLIKKSAKVNIRSQFNSTPLHYTIHINNEVTLKAVLEAGADISFYNNCHLTPLHLAASSGNKAIVRILLEAGADKDAQKTKNSTTPLYNAVYLGHKEVVEILLRAGADVALTSFCRTPLEEALAGYASYKQRHAQTQKKDENFIETIHLLLLMDNRRRKCIFGCAGAFKNTSF